ncbi:MAG: 3-oxoacyl-ACP synthase [Spirochaetaceae bacterium]|jgi:3-oxoacyl-[acyl-carrier-protein] synthase-1|nr:3-oxoacyl-ACP synthase [Spirochaetaceae bacterium]
MNTPSSSKKRPIYLYPPGVICAPGRNRREFLRAAREGDQRGLKKIFAGDKFFPAGLIEGNLPEVSGDLGPDPGKYTFQTRLIRLTDAVLEQIRDDVAYVIGRFGPNRIGVCAGSCDNGSEGSRFAHAAFFAGAFPQDYALKFQSAGYISQYIARKFRITGPAVTISLACASSAGAIAKAGELIRAGLCDAVIAGGADILSQTVLLGFRALETIADTPANPFSKNRRGLTLGEAGAFFVLSKEKREKIPGIALLGAGESSDAYHLTAPHPNGKGAIQAMNQALAQAGLPPEAVDYLNLHGTGTLLNDPMEAQAVAAIFPHYLDRPIVSSTKPITGHTLGAAGALELALCWTILADTPGSGAGLPIHCWDGVRDEALPELHFADSTPGPANPSVCMSNSFAFGGCNVSLILGKSAE